MILYASTCPVDLKANRSFGTQLKVYLTNSPVYSYRVNQRIKSTINTLSELWPIVTSLIVLVFILSSALTRQDLMAQKIDKIEIIKDDINQIKIRVERIDATLEQINKGK